MARSDALACPSVFSRNREFKSPRTRTDGLWILRKARCPSDLAAVTALRAGRDDPRVQHPQGVCDSPRAAARRSLRQIQVAAFSPSPGQLSHVLARRCTVCLRHPHRYHVGQVDDHATLAGLAVISGLGQDQAAPVVQRLSDGLKRLALPAEVLRYHRDVFTADRVKSHDQHDVVRHSRYLPARIQKTAWPGRGPGALIRRGSLADPDTVKCASPAARQSPAQVAGRLCLPAAPAATGLLARPAARPGLTHEPAPVDVPGPVPRRAAGVTGTTSGARSMRTAPRRPRRDAPMPVWDNDRTGERRCLVWPAGDSRPSGRHRVAASSSFSAGPRPAPARMPWWPAPA